MGWRLEDLYMTGRDMTLSDGEREVKVYISKLTPFDQEKAYNRANAERAKVLAVKTRKDSNEYLAISADASEMDREVLIEYLTNDHMNKKRAVIEARTAFEKKWTEDNYLIGLQDAWANILDEEEDQESAEALRVRAELDRYEADCKKEIDAEEADFRDNLSKRTDEWLMEHVVDLMVKMQADLAWLMEHRYCQVWLAVRDPKNHDKRYFPGDDHSAVKKIDTEIYKKLLYAYQNLEVPPDEGKDLPRVPDSSDSSNAPENQEVSVS